jgi:hypothetical protein
MVRAGDNRKWMTMSQPSVLPGIEAARTALAMDRDATDAPIERGLAAALGVACRIWCLPALLLAWSAIALLLAITRVSAWIFRHARLSRTTAFPAARLTTLTACGVVPAVGERVRISRGG